MTTELRDTSPAPAAPSATGGKRRRWRHLLGILGSVVAMAISYVRG